MIDPDALNIWNDQSLVGYLWRNPPVEQQPSTECEYHPFTDEELANMVARRGHVYTCSQLYNG